MPQSYDDAADEVRDAGFIHPQDIREREIQAQMRRYMFLEDPNSAGANRLIEKATEAAMDQVVRDASGELFGKRRDLSVWEDRWGNVMASRTEEGTTYRTKLVDSDDR